MSTRGRHRDLEAMTCYDRYRGYHGDLAAIGVYSLDLSKLRLVQLQLIEQQ